VTIPWDPGLETGIPSLDAQHRELYQRIDRLLDPVAAHAVRSEVGAVLEFLDGYVREHFRVEEELMASAKYPAAAEHHAEHALFARELQALVEEYARTGGTAFLAVRVTGRMTRWLHEHVRRADMQLGRFVGQHPPT
jgi:hemerythrin